MALYTGVGGKARKIKSLYVGVDGKARQVQKAYVGVNGQARLFYEYETKTANWEAIFTANPSIYSPYKFYAVNEVGTYPHMTSHFGQIFELGILYDPSVTQLYLLRNIYNPLYDEFGLLGPFMAFTTSSQQSVYLSNQEAISLLNRLWQRGGDGWFQVAIAPNAVMNNASPREVVGDLVYMAYMTRNMSVLGAFDLFAYIKPLGINEETYIRGDYVYVSMTNAIFV